MNRRQHEHGAGTYERAGWHAPWDTPGGRDELAWGGQGDYTPARERAPHYRRTETHAGNSYPGADPDYRREYRFESDSHEDMSRRRRDPWGRGSAYGMGLGHESAGGVYAGSGPRYGRDDHWRDVPGEGHAGTGYGGRAEWRYGGHGRPSGEGNFSGYEEGGTHGYGQHLHSTGHAPGPWSDSGRTEAGRDGRPGSYRGRGPKGYTRSDERLREDICERLSEDDRVDASDVSVTCTNGVVTLEGTVPERAMKHRIEDLVDACHGVKDIQNHIAVTRHIDWRDVPNTERGASVTAHGGDETSSEATATSKSQR